MAQINDAKKETLANLGYVYTAVDDAYKAYLQTESGLTEGTIQDLEKYLFEFLGYSGTLQSMWFEFLRDNGYTNTLQDMLHAFWNSDSAGLSPLYFSDFYAPLTHTAVPERAAAGTTSTFTRATTSTWQNNDGYMVTGVAGEIGFVGARRIYNRVPNSETLTAAAGWSLSSITTPGSATAVAPDGTTTAWILTASGAPGQWYKQITGLVPSGSGLSHIWLRRNTGTGTVGLFTAAGAFAGDLAITSEWVQYSLKTTTTAGGTSYFGIQITTSGDKVEVWHPQFEDVTAQTTQTAGEYVSVGVTSAPYYHGSMVDGVKCFPTDLSGNPLPTQYTYDAVSLNGVAGTYVSTPDSVAASVTGDIDIRAAFTTTSLTTDQVVISKTTAAAGNKSWVLYLNNAGKMQGLFYHDGTNLAVNFAASVTLASLGFSANSRIDVRATYQTSSSILTWYYSTDSGATWTSMGASSFVGVAGIFDGNAPVELGTQFAGTSLPLSGKVYEAQIYNGIDGTLAVDFDASRYAGGTTLTGSTGETWTLQGNAVIHPTNSPMLGYQAQGARTNLTIWNRDLTNAAWTRRSGTVTTALTAVGADGAANSATAVRNLGASGVDDLYQTAAYAVTAGVRVEPSLSLRAVSTSGTLRFANAYDVGASGAWNIDLSLVSTTRMERITRNHPSVTITSEWVGGSLNFVQPIFDTTTGPLNFDVDVIQVELGSFASSPIATTTAAVTRNADVLTYSSAGNIDGTKGWCYAEFDVANDSDGNQNIILGSDVAGVFPLYAQPSLGNVRTLDGTNAPIAQSAPMTGVRKGAGTWGGSTLQSAHNGVISSTTAFDGDMEVTAVIRVGEDNAGNSHFFGTIRNVRIGQRALSSSELQAVTS